MSVNRKLAVGYIFGLVAAVGIVCFAGAKWFVRNTGPSHSEHEAHRWLHGQLRLTSDQEHRLEPLEERFAAERKNYLVELGSANRALAAAIRSEGRFTPNVEAAIERIHRAQGEFQKASIRHCLEMKEYLTEEQWKKLLQMATQALEHDGE